MVTQGMSRRRWVILGMACLLGGGSLIWTAGYGLYLRGESYRRDVEHGLTDFFNLPCRVGSIRGHTFSSRTFRDVEVWLPGQRHRVFFCRQAIWREIDQRGQDAFELDLNDGELMLGGDRWARSDYQQVFESGLGHDFRDLHLTHVNMANFSIRFASGPLTIRCQQTSGRIDMNQGTEGVAHLVAYELNDHRVDQGVRIDARFLPESGVNVSEFVLLLPEVPLNATGIGPALGGDVLHGSFSGRMQYRKTSDGAVLLLDGALENADLSELTTMLTWGPLHGNLSVRLYEARVSHSTVTHLRGHGVVSDLSLAEFGPLRGRPALAGTATLNLDAVDLAMGHVNRLRMDGVLWGLSLEAWLQLLGRGSATGEVTIRINNLDIVADSIRSADVEVSAVPPATGPGTIDQDLLVSAAEHLFNFAWPESLPKRILPEHVEYAQFGVRLLVRDNQLRILGTHGSDGDTILTSRARGTPIGLIREPDGTIDLTPYLSARRARVRSYDPNRVRRWLGSGTANALEKTNHDGPDDAGVPTTSSRADLKAPPP